MEARSPASRPALMQPGVPRVVEQGRALPDCEVILYRKVAIRILHQDCNLHLQVRQLSLEPRHDMPPPIQQLAPLSQHDPTAAPVAATVLSLRRLDATGSSEGPEPSQVGTTTPTTTTSLGACLARAALTNRWKPL
jgi:hypothetical protein